MKRHFAFVGIACVLIGLGLLFFLSSAADFDSASELTPLSESTSSSEATPVQEEPADLVLAPFAANRAVSHAGASSELANDSSRPNVVYEASQAKDDDWRTA